MDTLRLEVRNRSILLDRRDFVFIAEDGAEVEKSNTEGVVRRITRYVNRHLRGFARVHGRAQLLQALRQFNSPREDYTQFVVVEPEAVQRLASQDARHRERALDEAVVGAIRARLPVDLQAMERWAKDHGLFVGLSGKNQILGGKARLTTEGLLSNFEPEKLVARSLLDKPEAFRGGTLRLLVVDDPFVNAVTGDGALLLRATAPRACQRDVSQRVRRCLDYQVRDARRGEVYLRLEFSEKVARHDTEIRSVVEDGDLLLVQKRERARIDTGAMLVHEEGFKGTAIVVNKWDLVKKTDKTAVEYARQIKEDFKFMPYAPILFVSAKTGQRVGQVLDVALKIKAERQKRIPTGVLNQLINDALLAHAPPSVKGRALKIYYVTQASAEPPTFVFFVNDPRLVHFSYERFLENRIRESLSFQGTPLRIQFRRRSERKE